MIAWSEPPPEIGVGVQGLFAVALIGLSFLLLRSFGIGWLRGVEPTERGEPGPWTTVHLVWVVVVGIVTQIIAGSMLQMYASARGIEYEDMRAGTVLLANCFWQGSLVALLLLVARNAPAGFASMGLKRTTWQAIGVGLGVYLFALPAILASGILWQIVLEYFGEGAATQAVQELIARTSGPEAMLAAFLAIVVIPFLEEAIFRGWLQGWISRRLDPQNGILIPAVLFAVLHGMPVLLPIFTLALVLGVVRHHTDRLAPVCAIHALHNGSQVLLLFGYAQLPDEGVSLPSTGLMTVLLPWMQGLYS